MGGGEKARLLFAMISYDAPHMLLLDEPTNHLDMDAREGLVQALNAYEGAVVIVSHDPSIVERVVDRLWLVRDGACHPFDGDLDAYREYILDQRRKEKRAGKPAGPSKKELQRQAAEKRKAFPQLHKLMEDTEAVLNRLVKERKQMDAQMSAADFYSSGEATVQAVQRAYGRLLREIEEAEAAWMEASEAFEAA
jgi:ATP-binding cassette subfamily F protein 3